ncbi:type VII secretion integral membrane protein EccD [Thermomonospora cellulosilytica]|uniref:Type VII secretion integral membrane protein EccD n=1 Tax=Thermomonospora cellulosilytica TaxID=1411118 RepID=A0A7W3N3B3_9ACTN|nr:type VII secretion integral membrane protein EccD [Thermomonospora cellulosilytica]MBA9006724.1 type VII secretion integral membrane protein EccD [Thermomonospora cellulosilytica]
MAAWSRVTLVGEHRRVDMVLPAQEPIGALMPDVLQLLGDPVQSPPRLRHLVTSTGEVLDPGATLADRRIPDGAVLRLVRADEPLPAPVVHEVPEVVGDALGGHLWRWGPAAARWSAVCAFVALTFAVGLVLGGAVPAAAAPAALGGPAAALVAGGVALGMFRRRDLGAALTLGGGTMGALAVWSAADVHDWAGWARWGGIAILAAVVVAVLGPASPLGRGGLIGGGVALLLAVEGTLCAAFGLDSARTAAVLAVTCVIVLHMLLRAALTLSGLTSLDDRRGEGSEVARRDVLAALDDAHRSMTIGTAAVAVAAVVAGLGATARFDWWTAALAGLLALVVASRARMFPLVLEKVALLAAAVVVVTALAVRWTAHVAWGVVPALGMLLAGLAIPVVVLTAEQPEHLRARLRRITNRIEAVAVVALVPVAIGIFGVFARLLGTF